MLEIMSPMLLNIMLSMLSIYAVHVVQSITAAHVAMFCRLFMMLWLQLSNMTSRCLVLLMLQPIKLSLEN